jgi:hypothetical protein
LEEEPDKWVPPISEKGKRKEKGTGERGAAG